MLKLNKIYNYDCLTFLKKIEDESIDLAVIDPPYNILDVEWDKFKSHKDFLKFTFSWIDALLPKIKPMGSLYIFNTPFNSAFILQHLVDKKMHFQNWITWDKRDGFSATKKKYTSAQETILFFTKSSKYTFNANDVRIPYESTSRIEHAKKKGILKNGKRWFPNADGKLCTEVWHIASERHKSKINGKTVKQPHLTPKPLEMIERIVKASSKKNDIVLDCFVGTGTTAIAALKHQRNFICNDKDIEYKELATNKIKAYELNIKHISEQ